MCVVSFLSQKMLAITAVATAVLCCGGSASADKVFITSNSIPGSISLFDIDADGQLVNGGTPVTLQASSASNLVDLAVTRDGSYVYALDYNSSGNIFALEPGSGNSLSQLSTSPLAMAGNPMAIVMSPDGESIYASNAGSTPNIRQMDIGVDGTLTDKTGGTVATAAYVSALGVNPQGNSLYVSNLDGNTIRYPLDSEGTVGSSAASVSHGSSYASHLVFTPDGDNMYAGTNSRIYQYSVDGTGVLAAKSPATIDLTGSIADFAVSPAGNSLYAVTRESQTDPEDPFNYIFTTYLFRFSISEEGLLTDQEEVVLEDVSSPRGLLISNDGKHLYIGESSTGRVHMFTVDQNTGDLTAKNPATVTVNSAANDMLGVPANTPVAEFSHGDASEDTPTTFDASASSGASSYVWDFGDGSTSVTTGAETVEHTYENPGSYEVSLQAVSLCLDDIIYTSKDYYCSPSETNLSSATATINVADVETPPTVTEPVPSSTVSPVVGVVSLLAGKSGPKVKGRSVAVTVGCSGSGGCSGTLSLTAKVRDSKSRKAVTVAVGKLPFSVDASSNRRFTVKLSKLGKKLLSKRGSLKARVKLQGADGVVVASQRVKFKKTKKR